MSDPTRDVPVEPEGIPRQIVDDQQGASGAGGMGADEEAMPPAGPGETVDGLMDDDGAE